MMLKIANSNSRPKYFVKLCTKTYQNKVQIKAEFVGNFLKSLSSMSGKLLQPKKLFSRWS